jgi:hypothetical protein
MSNHYPVLAALAAGLTINVVDVGSTLLFAAKPWEKELRRQGLEPRAATPPYYVLTNFVGGSYSPTCHSGSRRRSETLCRPP